MLTLKQCFCRFTIWMLAVTVSVGAGLYCFDLHSVKAGGIVEETVVVTHDPQEGVDVLRQAICAVESEIAFHQKACRSIGNAAVVADIKRQADRMLALQADMHDELSSINKGLTRKQRALTRLRLGLVDMLDVDGDLVLIQKAKNDIAALNKDRNAQEEAIAALAGRQARHVETLNAHQQHTDALTALNAEKEWLAASLLIHKRQAASASPMAVMADQNDGNATRSPLMLILSIIAGSLVAGIAGIFSTESVAKLTLPEPRQFHRAKPRRIQRLAGTARRRK